MNVITLYKENTVARVSLQADWPGGNFTKKYQTTTDINQIIKHH